MFRLLVPYNTSRWRILGNSIMIVGLVLGLDHEFLPVFIQKFSSMLRMFWRTSFGLFLFFIDSFKVKLALLWQEVTPFYIKRQYAEIVCEYLISYHWVLILILNDNSSACYCFVFYTKYSYIKLPIEDW